MQNLKHSIIFIFLLSLMLAGSAFGGHIYQNTLTWGTACPGGFYGIVEVEGMPTLPGGHTVWETHFLFGPLQFSVPFRVPVALCLVVGMLGVASWLVAVLFRRYRKD